MKPCYNTGLSGTITADSTPDYDGWGWDSYWSAEEWIQWHKALKAKYGQQQANDIWKQAWFGQGAFDHPFNWYKYNTTFANYFQSQGINVGNTFSNVLVKSGDLVDNTVNDVVSTAGNATGAATNITSTIQKAVPLLLWTLAGGIGYLIYKEAKSGSIKDIAKLTPAGAAKAALKK